VQLTNSLNFLLVGNSILIMFLIFNQNESTKDVITNRNSTPSTTPLENITWGCFVFQLILLLIKTKTTD
jgi:hypothetical protein